MTVSFVNSAAFSTNKITNSNNFAMALEQNAIVNLKTAFNTAQLVTTHQHMPAVDTNILMQYCYIPLHKA